MRPLRSILLLAALAALTGPAGAAGPAALADAGRVLEARAGTFGDFFAATADGTPAAMPVLVLEIADAAGVRERQLVPGTGDAAVERRPLILYDRARDALNLLYEKVSSDGISLHLAGYGADGWTEVHQLLSHDSADGRPLDRALTRASLRWQIADGAELHSDRTILHMVGRSADGDIRYTPLIFLQGAFVGWNDSFSLLDLFEAESGLPGAEPAAPLREALSVREDADGEGLSVAFTDPRSGRVVALDIAIEPLELVYFAAEVRSALEALIDDYQPGSAESIRGPMRFTIITGGTNLGLELPTVTYVADTVDAWAQEWTAIHPEADFATFAAAFRDLLDDLILAIFTSGGAGQAIELDLSHPESGAAALAQLLDVRVVSTWPAPATGPGLTRIYPSADGGRIAIGWYDQAAGAVRYVESRDDPDDPWSSVQVVPLRDGFGLGRIHALLGARAE